MKVTSKLEIYITISLLKLESGIKYFQVKNIPTMDYLGKFRQIHITKYIKEIEPNER